MLASPRTEPVRKIHEVLFLYLVENLHHRGLGDFVFQGRDSQWLTMFVAYFFAYVITPMDLTWHLGTSLGRLYVQLWPSFIFLSLAAFGSAEEVVMPREIVSAPAGKAKKRKK
jgi:hypothetical protein